MIARAERAGCYTVQFVSLNLRTDANAFHRRHGFEPVAQGMSRYVGGYAPPYAGPASTASSSDPCPSVDITPA